MRIVVCIGSGPSLTRADVDYCRGKATVLAINDSYQWAPWADALYAADAQWWKWHRDVPDGDLPLRKYALQADARIYRPDVEILHYTGTDGIDWTPNNVRTGGHGGYQAINLAAHFRPQVIVLLGYDLQPSADGRHHAFADHPVSSARNETRYVRWLLHYDGLAAELGTHGIGIVNASRATAIPGDAIPRAPIETLL